MASDFSLHCLPMSQSRFYRHPDDIITKTRLYNFDPLKPHFYIVKLGFTGVYIIFLILLKKNKDCGTRSNRLAEAVLTSTHNLCFEQKYEKYQIFKSENFPFLVVKFSIYLNRRVFVMWWQEWHRFRYPLSEFRTKRVVWFRCSMIIT